MNISASYKKTLVEMYTCVHHVRGNSKLSVFLFSSMSLLWNARMRSRLVMWFMSEMRLVLAGLSHMSEVSSLLSNHIRMMFVRNLSFADNDNS